MLVQLATALKEPSSEAEATLKVPTAKVALTVSLIGAVNGHMNARLILNLMPEGCLTGRVLLSEAAV